MLNYKKPVFWVILTVILLCVTTAILFMVMPRSEGGESTPTFSFEARVLEKYEGEWLVEPLEGTNERRSSDKINVRLPDGFEGDYETESIIIITYDGMIQELYPAIIPNVFEIKLAE
ncbi:MAG: hypothetical protein IJN17_02080 [Clostridia bacterium]|nr:hypothetical protein [Clostridia bacterium]